jgi:hypothetical protein
MLEPWADRGDSLRGGANRNDLKLNQIVPACHPEVQELGVVALHHLIAAAKVFAHPTGDVVQAVRSQSPVIPEATVHWNRIVVAEVPTPAAAEGPLHS